MQLEELDKIVEAILFVAGGPVAMEDICSKLELQHSEVTAAYESLKKKYDAKSGVTLMKFNGKFQFSSNPRYADSVSTVLNPIKEKELSRACLETVAIVAYKQPITKLEIEEVRGVSSDYALQVLEKHKLIEVVGRKDAIGKPLLFGTTEEFLKRFQLENIDKLPDYDQLLLRLTKIEAPQDNSLYNRFEIPAEEEIPEFLAEETLTKIE